MMELIISIVIGAVLMGTLYELFYAGNRINRDTQNKSEALQAATLALATVQQDIKQMVTLPVARKASGEIDNRFGDHQVPVRISPAGRNITFYVPDPATKKGELPAPGAVAVCYSLEPAENGLFRVKRTEETGDPKDDESRSRVITAVTVKDMKFRLLDPKASTPEQRSPDQSYYVEAVVTGTDATGRETMTMTGLTQLEYPSTFQQSHNKYANETMVFKPKAPLPRVPDKRSYTKTEFDALERLRELADKFEKGDVNARDLEDQVRRVVEIADGQPQGRKDVVATNGPVTPLGKTPLSLLPRTPGRPLEFSTPGGDRIAVPTSPDQTNQRIIDEIARRGNGGAGNVRMVMTDTFADFRPTGGGGLAVANQGGRTRTGNVAFNSDAGADFSRIHDDAVRSFSTPTARFFEGFGLPPP